jgi:Fe-S cluster biogenesis protein NfuA
LDNKPNNIEIDFENIDDVSKEIIDILEKHVKPAVASDGGNIVFQSYDQESKNVNVILQGACSGCPSSTITLKNGIENMLKEMLPGMISEVNAING